MQTWINVAYLAKTRNLNGRFVARSAAGLPFLLEVGDEVAFVPPQLDAPRQAVVSDVRLIDDYSAEVAFEGVDGEAAGILVGCHCLIPRDSLDESVFEDVPGMWEGWTVLDAKAGEVGAISDIIENPGQDLLEVEKPDGSTVLVPVVDEIVLDVDADARIVRVGLPAGLLDL